KIQGPDPTGRDSVGTCEYFKTTIAVTGQTTVIKPQPEIAGRIFAVGRRRGERRHSLHFRIGMKRFGGSIPTNHCVTNTRSKTEPNIATRVFKQTKEIITGQIAVVVTVDRLRKGVC